MQIGEIFKEEIKILRGLDHNRKPIIETIIINWIVVEIYDNKCFLVKNKNGESKIIFA